MNLIWNKNIALFKQRFESLAKLLEKEISYFDQYAGKEEEASILYPFWNIKETKSGYLTAEENSLRLHSAYNPQKEAETLIIAKEKEIKKSKAMIFLGFGLAYSALYAAKNFPEKNIILVEPDLNHFLAVMLLVNLEELFQHKSLILACGAPADQTITLINQYGIHKSVFFSVQAQTSHAQPYFDTLSTLIQRNKNKEDINNATLEKFRKLWLKNSKANIYRTALLEGVSIYKNKADNLPFLVLGAGPSLSRILPYLNELKDKVITVCVDTALRACLNQNFQPDFIVLTDPQYWAYRHIAGLKSPESILITENAVYPSVFNFECKKIVCCSSQIPLGQFFEKFCGNQGYLGSGGSVASCAWTFSKLAGAKKIYLSGLDLAFPDKQTHIKGSTFEQKVHSNSLKIKPAELASLPLLYSGNASWEENYKRKPVLSDQRMKMFAWWFESNIAASPETETFTLSPEGLKIPGVKTAKIKELTSLPVIKDKKSAFLSIHESEENIKNKKNNFLKAKKLFNDEITTARNLCLEALKELKKGSTETNIENIKNDLSKLNISTLLGLIPPADLSSFSKEEEDCIFFKSISDFTGSYSL